MPFLHCDAAPSPQEDSLTVTLNYWNGNIILSYITYYLSLIFVICIISLTIFISLPQSFLVMLSITKDSEIPFLKSLFQVLEKIMVEESRIMNSIAIPVSIPAMINSIWTIKQTKIGAHAPKAFPFFRHPFQQQFLLFKQYWFVCWRTAWFHLSVIFAVFIS